MANEAYACNVLLFFREQGCSLIGIFCTSAHPPHCQIKFDFRSYEEHTEIQDGGNMKDYST
uniref:Uncharacterized protein n=1 Tax=Oryza sativa subsp. japonica TaxID=39947 RepID=Q2QZZ8_ORYSJ|nr:hypothetical protein LOC_Os11g44280 [Oryza sativa Japonica Group]